MDAIKDCCLMLIMVALFTVLGYLTAVKVLIDGKPTAINVYQGKTTLEYTISDGVKTDSVVVFKNKNEKKSH